jgi:hypothetical protein
MTVHNDHHNGRHLTLHPRAIVFLYVRAALVFIARLSMTSKRLLMSGHLKPKGH